MSWTPDSEASFFQKNALFLHSFVVRARTFFDCSCSDAREGRTKKGRRNTAEPKMIVVVDILIGG